MASNLSIQAPDFAGIRKEAGIATRDAAQTLWIALNELNRSARVGIRQALERRRGKVLSLAPSAQQDNFDAQGAYLVEFTGADNFTLTGIRNGEVGDTITFHNRGSATITFAHASASSAAANRLSHQSAGDVTRGAGTTIIYHYLGNSLWNQQYLA